MLFCKYGQSKRTAFSKCGQILIIVVVSISKGQRLSLYLKKIIFANSNNLCLRTKRQKILNRTNLDQIFTFSQKTFAILETVDCEFYPLHSLYTTIFRTFLVNLKACLHFTNYRKVILEYRRCFQRFEMKIVNSKLSYYLKN